MSFMTRPPSGEHRSAAPRDQKASRRTVVLLCAAAAFVYGLVRADSPEPLFRVSYAVGASVGFLALPALLAFVTRKSEKWHYTFAAAFAVLFFLSTLGNFLR